MTDLASYIAAVNRAISSEHGAALAKLLSLPPSPHALSVELRSLAGKVSHNTAMMTQCEGRVGNGLGSLVGSRLGALAAVSSSNWIEANHCANAMYNHMLNAFREDGTGWMIPVVNTVSNDVRILATEVRMIFNSTSLGEYCNTTVFVFRQIKHYTTETMRC